MSCCGVALDTVVDDARAATTSPVWSRSGTEIEISSGSSSPATTDHPWDWTCRRMPRSVVGSVTVRLVIAGTPAARTPVMTS